MLHIADSKIGTIHSKPNVKYPMIRLPQEYSQIIGQRAHIYETDHEGQPAFLVVPFLPDTAQPIAERDSQVAKLSLETDIKNSLFALELEVKELRSFLLANQGDSIRNTQKTNGLGRIRTGDLRRVNTEALAFTPLFLDRSEVFLDTFADDTTTRNASAPSCTVW
jgi:hypothetical protein